MSCWKCCWDKVQMYKKPFTFWLCPKSNPHITDRMFA